MITKDMRISKILKEYPQTRSVFYEYDLSECFHCLQAKFETLEQASVVHFFDLEEMLTSLNNAVLEFEQIHKPQSTKGIN